MYSLIQYSIIRPKLPLTIRRSLSLLKDGKKLNQDTGQQLRKETESGFVTISEAANQLSISADTVRRWAWRGLIRSDRPTGRNRLYHLKSVREKLSGRQRPFRILENHLKTNFKVLELFAGGGGLALGLENAGLQSHLLVENNRDACATLRKNWPDKQLLERDIESIDFSSYRGEVDVVSGGFPCQAFSSVGARRGFGDTRGTLFFELARCVEQVQPKIIVGENVSGLLKHDGGRTLDTMLATFHQLGYQTETRLLRAQFLDVPQKRERMFILGVREDVPTKPMFPKEQDYTLCVREALRGVPESEGLTYDAKTISVLEQVPEGGNWKSLPEQVAREYMGAGYGSGNYARRLAWDEPCLTLICRPREKRSERCHPSEIRPLTVRECARIQSFPDSWEFSGSLASMYRQIGNAVPVNLAYHVGLSVISMLEEASKNEGLQGKRRS